MGLSYLNLDEATRRYMIEEIEIDASDLYLSPRLNEKGLAEYPSVLREAAQTHDDDWLAARIQERGLLKFKEQRRKPKGGYTLVDVPYTAHETMAEGEFNRFYIRGLCRHAIDSGIQELIVYRAKEVAHPRSASLALIGTRISPRALLDDLRAHSGETPALKMPGGPNSGLSVRLP